MKRKFADWELLINEPALRIDNWEQRLAEFIEGSSRPDEILKEDHRGMVGIVLIDGGKFVVKHFTLQRSWFWFRLTSSLFPSLGEIAYRNALTLLDSGVGTPSPVMLLQRRKFGMVRESRLLYDFAEGRTLTTNDGPAIVDFVRRMHRSGWIHRDPHPGNFIESAEGIVTIDPIRARRSNSRYARAYDVVLMSHDLPNAADLYGREALGSFLKWAGAGHNLLRSYRNIKRRLRRLSGLQELNRQ